MASAQSPEITVVVPIKNGGRFVRDCFDSLFNQEFKDFEIVTIIDTTSTDDTESLVDAQLERFPNLRIIKNPGEGGLGHNRNIGMDAARGRYIWFFDVDDIVPPDFLSRMHSTAVDRGCDIVVCNFVRLDEKTKKLPYYPEGRVLELSRYEAFRARADERLPVSTWSKLFSADLLRKIGVRFADGFAEDVLHTYIALSEAEKVAYITKPLYGYRQHKDSITIDKANADRRGQYEIRAYTELRRFFKGGPFGDLLSYRLAILEIRASSHMTKKSFLQYAKSERTRALYRNYVKGHHTVEWMFGLSPRLYYFAIHFYCRFFFYRVGRTYTEV